MEMSEGKYNRVRDERDEARTLLAEARELLPTYEDESGATAGLVEAICIEGGELERARARVGELEADASEFSRRHSNLAETVVRPLQARVSTFEAALGYDTPWPLHEVLNHLADGADHLLRVHDCDADGHEHIRHAEQAARRIARALLNNRETLGNGGDRADPNAGELRDVLQKVIDDACRDGCRGTGIKRGGNDSGAPCKWEPCIRARALLANTKGPACAGSDLDASHRWVTEVATQRTYCADCGVDMEDLPEGTSASDTEADLPEGWEWDDANDHVFMASSSEGLVWFDEGLIVSVDGDNGAPVPVVLAVLRRARALGGTQVSDLAEIQRALGSGHGCIFFSPTKGYHCDILCADRSTWVTGSGTDIPSAVAAALRKARAVTTGHSAIPMGASDGE